MSTLRTGLDGYDWLLENKGIIGEIAVAPKWKIEVLYDQRGCRRNGIMEMGAAK